MFNDTVLVHGFVEDFLYFVRAKFACLVVNGISVSFFNN
ncbi:RAxF-45 family protein [Oceanobacillus luteolus]|uniref:RAxF-45 family protein n=2 Tax=Oceanobacillus luteolus TaxID=1274358 RepID=A0ABW4HV76_9BACI|nr:RAxF-45 family protein [Oceanobacillus luteolus]